MKGYRFRNEADIFHGFFVKRKPRAGRVVPESLQL